MYNRAGVNNLRPAGCIWPSQPFYAARHMIWELVNASTFCNEVKNFVLSYKNFYGRGLLRDYYKLSCMEKYSYCFQVITSCNLLVK
jgi:hypothetical protein